jgi:hypothetical protein
LGDRSTVLLVQGEASSSTPFSSLVQYVALVSKIVGLLIVARSDHIYIRQYKNLGVCFVAEGLERKTLSKDQHRSKAEAIIQGASA